MAIHIREESPGDIAGIRSLTMAAFEGTAEADLIDRLRNQNAITLSLVAVRCDLGETARGETARPVVGHILFSPVTFLHLPDPASKAETEPGAARAAGLAPMAVLPAEQRSGIGSQLVRAGLERLAADGCGSVIVLGHADFYPRFGFRPAHTMGIGSDYEEAGDAFMALALRPGALDPMAGWTARHHPAFAEL